MDIYTSDEHAANVAKLIMDASYDNAKDEGLVSITPVEQLFWIHTKQAVQEDEFKMIVPENNMKTIHKILLLTTLFTALVWALHSKC